jgi:hypothetical protein
MKRPVRSPPPQGRAAYGGWGRVLLPNALNRGPISACSPVEVVLVCELVAHRLACVVIALRNNPLLHGDRFMFCPLAIM